MSFFASIFGYVLWWLFNLTKNYGFAVILFTLVTKLLMLPMSIKQQKFTASNARVNLKREELQKKYKNDKQKLREELFKLQQKEQINPLGGCLASFLPIILLLIIYYAIINPTANMLHISNEKINEAVKVLTQLPGFENVKQYHQIEIIRAFPANQEQFAMFSPNEAQGILSLSKGFNLFGLDLLMTPKGTDFLDFLWLIPLFCFLTQIISIYFTMKIQGTQVPTGQGCSKYMMYFSTLITVWFAYIAPAAVGFYWIISNIFSFFQTMFLTKYYNTQAVGARDEAARIARRILEEEKVIKK
jgi:YidC/Oxa1 family membrane protein insertase